MMEKMMPNRKQIDVKRKHRKRRAKEKARISEQRKNASKANRGSWILSGVYL